MDDNKRMWMVRAGVRAFLINEFIENNLVAIGWNELQDLSRFSDTKSLKDELKKVYPEYKDSTINMNAGQLFRFLNEFNVGDYVITYNPGERVYWIGRISSEYYRSEGSIEYFNQRKVEWKGQVSRDDLSTSTKNSLGSIATIFEVSVDAREELLSVLLGKTDSPSQSRRNNDDELDNIRNDFIEKSHEFIKDKILRLDWEEMQELVAAVLRAMGYKTRVSPKGSDRGKDIIASPDGLGLEDPRILVEVKHRQGSMGSHEIRSFIGGIRTGDKGVYVSTAGFTRDAKYEADRANVPVTLIDSDYLVELITQNYDSFDSDGKTLVPLKKLYWPM